MPKNRIHKLKDGRYTYSATDSRGKLHKINSRKNESLSAFRKRCDHLDGQVLNEIREETFDDLFNEWLESHVKLNLSKSELRVTPPIYKSHVLPHLGHLKITEIKRRDVYDTLVIAQNKGLSASTIKKIRGCISRPYNWAINTLGFDIQSPTQGLIFKSNKENNRSVNKAISDNDLDRFFKASKNSKYYNYFQILILTGLRPSECLGLQIKDIKADRLEIRRGITIDGFSPLKTQNAKRDIPLNDSLKRVLLDQKRKIAFRTKEGWLFPAESGIPKMNALTNAFKYILRQTAVWDRGGRNKMKKEKMIKEPVDFTLYDFRHTFATKMAQNNMHHTALKKILGHSSIQITLQYYVELTDEMIDQAKELMSEII